MYLWKDNPRKLQVRLAEHDWEGTVPGWQADTETPSFDINIAEIHIHPEYRQTVHLLDLDLAMLKLSKEIDFQSTLNVRPICLPTETTDYAGRWAIVTGWGFNEDQNRTGGVLKEMQLTVQTQNICDQTYPGKYSKFLCYQAGDTQNAMADGDSGGPVIARWNYPNYELIGVHSVTYVP